MLSESVSDYFLSFFTAFVFCLINLVRYSHLWNVAPCCFGQGYVWTLFCVVKNIEKYDKQWKNYQISDICVLKGIQGSCLKLIHCCSWQCNSYNIEVCCGFSIHFQRENFRSVIEITHLLCYEVKFLMKMWRNSSFLQLSYNGCPDRMF